MNKIVFKAKETRGQRGRGQQYSISVFEDVYEQVREISDSTGKPIKHIFDELIQFALANTEVQRGETDD